MTERNYPFQGPRFKVGDKVRVKEMSRPMFVPHILSESAAANTLTVRAERIEQVDVDPDGQPYSLDYSHQLVTIEEFNSPKLEPSADHFELA